jgi:hypothetical protein
MTDLQAQELTTLRVSDSGSEMGATIRTKVRPDAAIAVPCCKLTSANKTHQPACKRANPVRDEEAAGSNLATPTGSNAGS